MHNVIKYDSNLFYETVCQFKCHAPASWVVRSNMFVHRNK